MSNKLKLLLASLCLTVCTGFNTPAYSYNNVNWIELENGPYLAYVLDNLCTDIYNTTNNTDVTSFVSNIKSLYTSMRYNNRYSTHNVNHLYMLLQSFESTLDLFLDEEKISDYEYHDLCDTVDNMISIVYNIKQQYNIDDDY